MDEFLKYPESDYGEGTLTEEYNGQISLCSAQEGKDGKVYKRWMFPQVKDKQPSAKAIPWKITLGNSPKEALERLEFHAQMIRESLGIPEKDDSVPF